ncbi:hypothetical protein C731_1987 [Mycolicibacterium hassiacum DSM 44199]|uniref:Uncharacterized protein n=1 Tax=Mycolicibacterium hassiacum (strain DSM 44199 / CIP 105218 / JCM 12690 / 3849) TaxID=1122247 RepID=K5BBH5_MYCHD|nr:hypothetical protein C731_1987 [Mycolicibacterium hassiacum DSM 44199]
MLLSGGEADGGWFSSEGGVASSSVVVVQVSVLAALALGVPGRV